jgi:hypothetical protein
LLELVEAVPPLLWGRDELDLGEMWNSNSVISWLLARTGMRPEEISPPAGGRAPGWDAGIRLAHLYETRETTRPATTIRELGPSDRPVIGTAERAAEITQRKRMWGSFSAVVRGSKASPKTASRVLAEIEA